MLFYFIIIFFCGGGGRGGNLSISMNVSQRRGGWGERGATAPLNQIARVLFMLGKFYFHGVSTI